MIRHILLTLGVLVMSSGIASAQLREIYTIQEIEVEESASSVIQAQQQAFTSARIKGAYELFERLTLPQDLSGKISPGSISAATANRLAAAVDVEEEERGGGRYVGKLAIVYNPATVRAYLEERSIPYIDRTAPKSVVFPVTSQGGAYAWNSAWPDKSFGRLAPFVTSRGTRVTASSGWADMGGDVNAAGARRGIKAELLGDAGNYRVRLSSTTAAGETGLGTTGSAATMEEAADLAATLLDRVWKEQSIVRSGERTEASSTVLFTSLVEWNSLRNALARSPIVFNFSIDGLSKRGAVVHFAYAGDEQRLISNLRERGVTLETDDMGWVMTSAITSVR
ncbi:hypothetical protein [Henriciella litoralis]|uniref:hypothetical protein n=1 Tax=Henriciella litoralis TaxID=568102 RepID=UPI000A0764B1|nr:hypothetical protein [Henriciella litoralis]